MSQLGKSGVTNNFARGTQSSGIFFNFPKGQQYTSYRVGDEGYRVQNGFFDIVLPSSPENIPQLDYSLGSNYWYRLKTPLTVGGVQSNVRFVDVNGLQVWGAANNVIDILIDKYTGLGVYRNINALPALTSWDTGVDNGLSLSTIVQGVTFDSFYLASLEEFLLIGGQYISNGWVDPITSQPVIHNTTGVADYFTSTTVPINTLLSYDPNPNPQMNIRTFQKNPPFVPCRGFYIFDARSLITV
jgi:hypothetical protein